MDDEIESKGDHARSYLLDGHKQDSPPLRLQQPRQPIISWIAIGWHALSCLMFLTGASMLILSHSTCACTNATCTEQLSLWSPILRDVQYEVRDFHGNTHGSMDIYTMPPSLETEAAWSQLEDMPAVLIPPDKLPALNRSTSDGFLEAAEPEKLGFVGTIEVFHHLHCLNMVRQYALRDEYPDDLVPWLLRHNSPAVAREHAGHCIGTLRQALMCNADLTPYLWYKGAPGELPKEDFAAAHKCKNFESIVASVKQHSAAISLRG